MKLRSPVEAVCSTRVAVASLILGTVMVHAQSSQPVIALQATFAETMFSQDGNVSMRKVRHYGRFADHSLFMQTDEFFPENVVRLTSILNTQSNVWIDLDSATHSSTTFKSKAADSVRRFIGGLAAESCGDVDLSKASQSDELFGYKTYYVMDHPDPAWTRERWVAPDLNCLPLKRIDSLSGGARDEEVVTELRVSDPPESLLAIPFGFTERDPDTVETMHKAARNGEVFWGPEILRKRRKDYAESR